MKIVFTGTNRVYHQVSLSIVSKTKGLLSNMDFQGKSLIEKYHLNWITIFAVPVFGHLMVVNTFWFHDDWFFLANAAGIAELDKGGSRWFSYVGYWKLMFPLFGLKPFFWGVSRLLLHGGSSWLVVRIGQSAGLGAKASLFAGLLFAGAPVAFESVYWATGAIELMGVFFFLVSIDQWLRGGKANILMATLLGIIAINSKEIGLLLPVLFFAHMVGTGKTKSRTHWLSIIVLTLAAVISAWLLFANLEGSTEYSLCLAIIPKNFLIMGFWIFAPPSYQTGSEVGLTWALAVGGFFWLGWLSLALWALKKMKSHVPLVALVICILTMAPVLPLETHIVPRYDYGPIAAASIGLIFFLKNKLNALGLRWFYLATILALVLTWSSTHYRLNARFPSGRPIHRLVVKEMISRVSCIGIAEMPLVENDMLVFFLEPTGNAVEVNYLQESLGGVLGPQVLLGKGIQAKWVSELSDEEIGSFVVSVNGIMLRSMGRYRPRR